MLYEINIIQNLTTFFYIWFIKTMNVKSRGSIYIYYDSVRHYKMYWMEKKTAYYSPEPVKMSFQFCK